ncbi:AAA ATPase [Saitoella coloradoensis]
MSSSTLGKRTRQSTITLTPGSGARSVSVSPSKRVCSPKKENVVPVTPTKNGRITNVFSAGKATVSLAKKPATPTLRTPTTPTVASPYTPIKTLFRRSAAPTTLTARDTERDFLNKWIKERVEGGKSGSMYVSGPPGTGKSVVLSSICAEMKKEEEGLKVVELNCMALNRVEEVYTAIANAINPDAAFTEDGLRKEFEKQACLVVLDEIDHLAEKEEVLYALYSLPHHPKSRLLLIGIANALDLTDRVVPRLRAKGVEPELVQFRPYKAEEIKEIILTKLETLKEEGEGEGLMLGEVMQPAAVTLLAKKVAASTGDLRKALDLCRRAIELVESEAKRAPLMPTQDQDQQTGVKRVTVAHIAKISASAFGTSTAQRLKTLNLQQKAVLCALCVSKSQTVGKLYENYTKLCKRDRMISPLGSSEFRDVIGSLEGCGVVNLGGAGVGGGGAGGNSPVKKGKGGDEDLRVGLGVPEVEVVGAVGDVGALKRFFD